MCLYDLHLDSSFKVKKKKGNEAGRTSWFGTNRVRGIYSVTEGFVCTSSTRKGEIEQSVRIELCQAKGLQPFCDYQNASQSKWCSPGAKNCR